MSKNFFTCLIPTANSDPSSDVEVAIQWEITQVQENRYHLPIRGDRGVKHFCLLLTSKYQYVDDEDKEWLSGTPGGSGFPLKFFYSGYGTPSPGVFSRHIYDECRAAFLSFERRQDQYYSRDFFRDRSEIDLADVWRYLKNLHKNYINTPDFIRDYNFWHNRLYQTQKWIAYMAGDLEWTSGDIAIGDKIYEFLDLLDQFDR